MAPCSISQRGGSPPGCVPSVDWGTLCSFHSRKTTGVSGVLHVPSVPLLIVIKGKIKRPLWPPGSLQRHRSLLLGTAHPTWPHRHRHCQVSVVSDSWRGAGARVLSDTSALHFAALSAAVFRKLSVRSRLRRVGPLWLSLCVWTVGSNGVCTAFKSPLRLCQGSWGFVTV